MAKSAFYLGNRDTECLMDLRRQMQYPAITQVGRLLHGQTTATVPIVLRASLVRELMQEVAELILVADVTQEFQEELDEDAEES
jgi:hypothetical protein